jgi:chemotaxis protein methyltransferase CheR
MAAMGWTATSSGKRVDTMPAQSAACSVSAPVANPAKADDFLSARSFEDLARRVTDHTGIRLPATKKQMVEGRLRKRAHALGMDLVGYCDWLLADDAPAAEFQHVVDAITTNKTDFYREPDHFEFLAKCAVPHLLKERRPLLKVWSAACSTGVEAYTAAMVLADLAGANRFRFAILGTDICTTVLAAAERAVYGGDVAAAIPPEQQRRYLLRSRKADEVRIVPELRRLVRFAQLNLMSGQYPVDRDVDIIFLRNVLIYFDKPTQVAVLRRLIRHLHPGGFLFLGHSESMIGTELGLREAGPAIFRWK